MVGSVIVFILEAQSRGKQVRGEAKLYFFSLQLPSHPP
jgi:hypothetical protein